MNNHIITYRPEIDGLRAVSVLSVIFFHAGFDLFNGGYLGVDIFFVISGYLITSIIIFELNNDVFSIKRFYVRRARRILPALYFTVLLSIPFAWFWMLPLQYLDFSESVLFNTFFMSNILFWQESGYFRPDADLKPLLHTWSLSVEEQYYLIFPFILLMLSKFNYKYITPVILTIIFLASLLMSEWASKYHLSANFYLLPSRFWELMAGALLAIFLNKYKMPNSIVSVLASNIGLIMILTAIFIFDEKTRSPGVITLLPIIGSVLLIAGTSSQSDSLSKSILSLKPIVFLGLISYSLYLIHQPVFAYVKLITLYDPSFPLVMALLSATLLLASFSWAYIEKPFRNPANFNNKAFLSVILGVSILFILFGTLGIYGKGLDSRFENNLNYKESLKLSKIIELESKTKHAAVKRGECLDGGAYSNKQFIEKWDCWGSSNNKIIFMGDSHAADKAAALVANGINVGWMTGGNCSIIPENMTQSCMDKFIYILNNIHKHNIEYIALANRFEMDELNQHTLSIALEFWRKFDKKIIIFTNMPEYINFSEILPRAARLGVDEEDINTKPNFDVAFKSEEMLLQLKEDNPDIIIINTRELLCSIDQSHKCNGIADNNTYLLLNEDHLSMAGLDLFGMKLINQLNKVTNL